MPREIDRLRDELFQPQSNLPDSSRWGHIKNQHILSTTPGGQIFDQKSFYAPIIPLSVPGPGEWGFQLTSALVYISVFLQIGRVAVRAF